MGQDDPKKCTAKKLARLGLAQSILKAQRIPRFAVVLNPTASKVFSTKDRNFLKGGLVAIDCSWRKANEVFSKRFRGENRRLPLLMAANPVHYSHIGILSSVEALAAALYIACLQNNEKKTQKDIAEAAGVTEVTVRNRYKTLKKQLSLELPD